MIVVELTSSKLDFFILDLQFNLRRSYKGVHSLISASSPLKYLKISLSSLEIALELRFTSMTDFHTLSTTLKLMKYYLDIITRYKIGFNRLFMLYQVQILFFTSRTRFAFKFLHQSLAFPIPIRMIYT